MNLKYVAAPLNANQAILFVVAQHLFLESVQILSLLIVIAWGAHASVRDTPGQDSSSA